MVSIFPPRDRREAYEYISNLHAKEIARRKTQYKCLTPQKYANDGVNINKKVIEDHLDEVMRKVRARFDIFKDTYNDVDGYVNRDNNSVHETRLHYALNRMMMD